MPPALRPRGESRNQVEEGLSDAVARFERALAALPEERGQLLPALMLAQEQLGHISNGAVERIALHVRMTVNEIEGVATAYPELHRHALGPRVIRVCIGLGCWNAGADRIVAGLTTTLGVQPGETTDNGGITIEETPCCFACGVAPVIEVDGVLHGRLTTEQAIAFATAPVGVLR